MKEPVRVGVQLLRALELFHALGGLLVAQAHALFTPLGPAAMMPTLLDDRAAAQRERSAVGSAFRGEQPLSPRRAAARSWRRRRSSQDMPRSGPSTAPSPHLGKSS